MGIVGGTWETSELPLFACWIWTLLVDVDVSQDGRWFPKCGSVFRSEERERL